MNAGDNIKGSIIKWNLKKHAHLFEKIIIVDGCLTEQAKIFYSQFNNLEVVDSPWCDDYAGQYKKGIERLNNNQWFLWLDCDESLSPGLITFICDNDWVNDPDLVYKIPCVLLISEDNKKYYAAEPPPPSSKDYNGKYWTKNILVKKDKTLSLSFRGSHVIIYHNNDHQHQRQKYIPYNYTHFKTLQSFCENDVFQAFLDPLAQQYSAQDASRYRLYTSKYKTTKEFKKATLDGTWPAPLQKFAWEKRHVYNNPVSRLAWTYYILCGHAMPEVDPLMTWDNVKQHIQSPENMAIYEQNKKLEQYTEIN